MRQHIRIHKAEPNTGVLDYRHLLDAPAGKHGFVQAREGHLYFEDGIRARFLGFNLPTRSNTPDHETAEKMAERFASLGVNVIRLHAADAPIGDEPGSWSSCREAPLLDYMSGTTRRFHPVGLDRFDYFIAKLKEKGIYLHIDLIVARQFLAGDGLPQDLPACLKCYTMVNEHLIKLQQEYAQELLCHMNPYTGLKLIDDPAVMTIQINNEDSVIKESQKSGTVQTLRDELQQRFGHFLLQKYHTRQNLAAAWTKDGICVLGEDEDPSQGTVRIVEGSFLQRANNPLGDWGGDESPARYADYMEFGIQMNRRFYRRMKDFLHGLGAKVPIATSNLLGGAADVYGHSDADVMENNSYFNHPMLPIPGPDMYVVAGPTEYVSVNPLTMQKGIGAMATSLVSLASTAAVAEKPFVLSEWNEYGLHPFHSTAYMSTIAYACLNDWDGLILYCHHTSEAWDDQPADKILNVFDFYNDPAVIGQWGFLATAFLKGLISPARHRVDIVYTHNDLHTLPNAHAINNTFLPYITAMKNVFLDSGERYHGPADMAVNAGHLNGCDLSEAKHSVYYAWSPYRDAFRESCDNNRLTLAARGTQQIQQGVHMGEKALVFDDIAAMASGYDYRAYAVLVDSAMKQWGILPEGTGLINGRLISETGEIVTDPQRSVFSVSSDGCAYFSGKPDGVITLGDRVSASVKNNRITMSLISHDGEPLVKSTSFVLTAMGVTGMDGTTISPVDVWPGVAFSMVHMQGQLFADTLEGTITVQCEDANLTALDTTGHVIQQIPGEKSEAGVVFYLDGTLPAINYHLTIM